MNCLSTNSAKTVMSNIVKISTQSHADTHVYIFGPSKRHTCLRHMWISPEYYPACTVQSGFMEVYSGSCTHSVTVLLDKSTSLY